MENNPNIEINKEGYSIVIFSGNSDPLNESDDNVDIQVNFSDGSFYAATFFTIENIKALFEKNRRSGECASGLYFFCPDMVVVETLNLDSIERVVEHLVDSGDLGIAFRLQSAST